MSSPLLPINESLSIQSSVVGGKAVGLGKLCALGAKVPEGVVVPSNVVMSPSLKWEINYAVCSFMIRFGSDIRLAIRSSSTLEDGHEASYAGMYRTILNVSPDCVVAAVEECQCSGVSARIAAYQEALNRGQARVAPIAVIIQRMLMPDYSGVVFTINPVTGNRSEMVIEAVSGLGDRLMSGEVTPDYYCLQLASGSLVNFQPGEEGIDDVPILLEERLQLIWREAKRIHDAFGYAVDIEFAFSDEYLYLLQARPVTASRQSETTD